MTPQRVTMITLGVASLDRDGAFYAALGWQKHARSLDDITLFQLNGLVLALFETSDLAADQGREDASLGTGNMTLAIAYATEPEADQAFASALEAGAQCLKALQKAAWGGYSGYYADPDGHIWEIAVNPNWPLSADGSVTLPPPAEG